MSICCCICGLQIIPNDVNMCMDCLRTELGMHGVDERQMELVQCGKCARWHVRQDKWMHFEMESTQLLAMLLRKISGILTSCTILDASWIWTEPHSRRIKINVDVERSVLDNKAQIRHKIIVEFTVKMKQCLECIREATDHSWETCVQIRQRVRVKRSLEAVESMLVQGGYYHLISNMVVAKDGLDLYFKEKQQAERVVEFLSVNFPTKSKLSKKLVSKDGKSNLGNYEYTILLEVAPLCKGDLVMFKKEVMVVHRVTSSIHLVSASSALRLEIQANVYFGKPIQVLLSASQLVPFLVLDINPVQGGLQKVLRMDDEQSQADGNSILAEAEVARESDLGVNDKKYTVLTHLGNVLNPGDMALGYDLRHTVVSDESFDQMSDTLPDVILVKKSYADKEKKGGAAAVSGRRFKKKKHAVYAELESRQLTAKASEGDDAAEEGPDEEEELELVAGVEGVLLEETGQS